MGAWPSGARYRRPRVEAARPLSPVLSGYVPVSTACTFPCLSKNDAMNGRVLNENVSSRYVPTVRPSFSMFFALGFSGGGYMPSQTHFSAPSLAGRALRVSSTNPLRHAAASKMTGGSAPPSGCDLRMPAKSNAGVDPAQPIRASSVWNDGVHELYTPPSRRRWRGDLGYKRRAVSRLYSAFTLLHGS